MARDRAARPEAKPYRLFVAISIPVEAADIAFNGVARPYVHLRGRHEWTAERARARVVGLVLNGVAGAQPVLSRPRRKEAR